MLFVPMRAIALRRMGWQAGTHRRVPIADMTYMTESLTARSAELLAATPRTVDEQDHQRLSHPMCPEDQVAYWCCRVDVR